MSLTRTKCFIAITGLLSLFAVSSVQALSSDRDQPILIEADKGMIDDVNGIAVYEGNVIVTQGTIRINANKVKLTYKDRQTLDKVVATGAPARFKQRPDKSDLDVNAKATQMEYYANEDRINLLGGAEVWKGQDIFTGERIAYDTQRGIIRADSGKSNERITVTIQPRNSKQ